MSDKDLIIAERDQIIKEVLRMPDVSPWFWGDSIGDAMAQLDAWMAGFREADKLKFTEARPEPCWTILQIDRTTDVAKIKAAYRSLAKEAHPDRGGSAKLFQRLNDAYVEAMLFAKGHHDRTPTTVQ